jgi:hypothetical protein
MRELSSQNLEAYPTMWRIIRKRCGFGKAFIVFLLFPINLIMG